jgi:hypothetical protein
VIDFELFRPELDTDDSKEQLATLQKLTERYCIFTGPCPTRRR